MPEKDPNKFELLFLDKRLEQKRISSPGAGRLRPSIITRGEVQLFSVSYPRFALRFNYPDGGFVNTRRIRELVLAVSVMDATRSDSVENGSFTQRLRKGPILFTAIPAIHPALVLQDQSQIADCLISPPKKNFPDFFFLSIDQNLFSAYGEPLPKSNLAFTSYVKNITLGGGICGQACCFMATVMLSRYSSNICGLAEITMRARRKPVGRGEMQRDAIPISELGQGEMAAYFKSIGLHMTEEAPTHGLVGKLSSRCLSHLSVALKGYIRSGMPVIFPTDQARLAIFPNDRKSVYGQNGYPVRERHFLGDISKKKISIDKNQGHACIFVGFQTEHGNKKPQFVFHDPGSHPYMKIHLADVPKVARTTLLYPEHGERTFEQDCGAVWSVKPSAVNLPLLYERIQYDGSYHANVGLMKLIEKNLAFRAILSTDLKGDRTLTRALLAHKGLIQSEFMLVSLDGMLSPIKGTTLNRDSPVYSDIEMSKNRRASLNSVFKREAAGLSDRGFQWVWLEVNGDYLWIWNAQVPPPEIQSVGSEEVLAHLSRYLLWCGKFFSG